MAETQNIECVYIKEEYFILHSQYVKILDAGHTQKQSKRSYLYMKIKYEGNNLFIPLSRNLGKAERVFGKIGYSVPNASRPNAGLDYRYILVVNDEKYIERPDSLRIPVSQYRTICDNYDKIEKEALAYVNGYVRTAVKDRTDKEAKYRESSLLNFHDELKVTEKKIERQKRSKLNNRQKLIDKNQATKIR